MPIYLFANSDYKDFEAYEIGDFPDYQAAVDNAKELADQIDVNIEIYELKHIIQPYYRFQNNTGYSVKELKRIRDETLTEKMKGD